MLAIHFISPEGRGDPYDHFIMIDSCTCNSRTSLQSCDKILMFGNWHLFMMFEISQGHMITIYNFLVGF